MAYDSKYYSCQVRIECRVDASKGYTMNKVRIRGFYIYKWLMYVKKDSCEGKD